MMFDTAHGGWQWYRCSILGCGASPLRVRPRPGLTQHWSVGFPDSDLWIVAGATPSCPHCGHGLDPLASPLNVLTTAEIRARAA